jgi:HD-like signal output (HDOD) protein
LVSDQVKFACLPSAMAQSVQERYAVEELMRDSMQRQMISLKLLKRWGMGQERARGT